MKGYLQGQKLLNGNCITKGHPSTGDGQLTKSGNLKHTAQPAGSSTGERMSLPSDSVALKCFLRLCWFHAAGPDITVFYCLLWQGGA